jgi:hypothetical protein
MQSRCCCLHSLAASAAAAAAAVQATATLPQGDTAFRATFALPQYGMLTAFHGSTTAGKAAAEPAAQTTSISTHQQLTYTDHAGQGFALLCISENCV